MTPPLVNDAFQQFLTPPVDDAFALSTTRGEVLFLVAVLLSNVCRRLPLPRVQGGFLRIVKARKHSFRVKISP